MKTGYNHKRKKEKTKHSAPFINSKGNQHQIKKIYILQAQRKDIDSSSQYHQKKKKKKKFSSEELERNENYTIKMYETVENIKRLAPKEKLIIKTK